MPEKSLWLVGGNCEPEVIKATERGAQNYLRNKMAEELKNLKEQGWFCPDPDKVELEKEGNSWHVAAEYSSDDSSVGTAWFYKITKIDSSFVTELNDTGECK